MQTLTRQQKIQVQYRSPVTSMTFQLSCIPDPIDYGGIPLSWNVMDVASDVYGTCIICFLCRFFGPWWFSCKKIKFIAILEAAILTKSFW